MQGKKFRSNKKIYFQRKLCPAWESKHREEKQCPHLFLLPRFCYSHIHKLLILLRWCLFGYEKVVYPIFIFFILYSTKKEILNLNIEKSFTESIFLYLFLRSILMFLMISLVVFEQHTSWYIKSNLDLPNYK